ncbi:MAG: SusC/RagA family TonB-linked outer membrane protein [Chitinophagaceae bacterium]
MYLNKIVRITRSAIVFCLLIHANSIYAQAPATSNSQQAPKLPLTGTVTDAVTKKAIIGATVSITGFSASITNEKGEFSINVPSYRDNITVSAEGYGARKIALKGRTTLSISLQDGTLPSLEESVTMPFAVVTKRELTAAAGLYNPHGEWKRPMETIDGLLQGQVAGLNSIRRSGTPGVGANLFLRGYNSLYGTNKPLIIVDGMIYDINDYGQSIIANNYTNPLALLNAQDIENVTVLKDATSIYGAKGANGVIIITTSRARKQATTIDFGAYTSVNQQPSDLPVMGAESYRTYLSEILQSKGLSSAEVAAMPFMKDDTTGNPEYYRYHNKTNWQDNIFKNSITNNYFLKVTGGDNIATYALSVGYAKSKGIIETTNLSRYDTRFNAEFNFSKRFTGSSNLSFTFNEQNLKDQGIAPKTAPLFQALTKAPFLTANEVNSKGVFSPNYEDVDILGIGNPSVLINKMQAYNKYYRFTGSFNFNYEIGKGLNASTLVGVLYDKVRENIFIPRKGVANDSVSNAVLDSRLGSQVKRLFSFYTDTRLEYKKTINRYHQFQTRLGLRYQHNDAEQDYALGFNSATDELISVQNGLNALRQIGGSIGEWNWMNTYFNAEYSFRDKFFLHVNAAMDGSSRFGTKTEDGIAINGVNFALFPSVSLAWLVSSENFMSNSKVDLLKLRASYGITGNDDIGNYTSRQSYGSQNLLGMQGLVRNGIANPHLQWESVQKINLGLDIAAFNERLSLSVDAFKNKTSKMLVYEQLPAASGFSNIVTNNGSMENIGIEATLNFRLINRKNFKWDVGVNAGTYKNKILAVPDGMFVTEYAGAGILTKTGSPANSFYGYVANGVYSTVADAIADGLMKKNADGSFSSFSAGDVRFKDVNRDKVIDENDREVIGDPNPDFFGGFTNRFSYKKFQLEALFTFTKGNDVFNYLRYRLESVNGVENQLQSVVNRWRAEGQQTSMPKATFGDPMGNSRFSNRWIEDGSYLRLRSVSLAYTLPVKEGFIKNATIYVAGNNLLTFTKYMGYDPEFSSSPSLFAQGIDTGLDPQFRSATLGVKMGF